MPSRNLADAFERGRTSFDMAARLDAIRAYIGHESVTYNSEPGGDGESGGNTAVSVYDPDGHYVEFSTAWTRATAIGLALARVLASNT